jgi:hypothetical protein
VFKAVMSGLESALVIRKSGNDDDAMFLVGIPKIVCAGLSDGRREFVRECVCSSDVDLTGDELVDLGVLGVAVLVGDTGELDDPRSDVLIFAGFSFRVEPPPIVLLLVIFTIGASVIVRVETCGLRAWAMASGAAN